MGQARERDPQDHRQYPGHVRRLAGCHGLVPGDDRRSRVAPGNQITASQSHGGPNLHCPLCKRFADPVPLPNTGPFAPRAAGGATGGKHQYQLFRTEVCLRRGRLSESRQLNSNIRVISINYEGRGNPLEILWAGGERQAQRRVRPLANLGRRRCLHLAPSTCAAVVEVICAAWTGRPDGYAKAATPVTSAQL